jgi:hypothetical protein
MKRKSAHGRSEALAPGARSAQGRPVSGPEMDQATLFVVRVWRQRQAFRASARRVDDEDTRLFVAAAELVDFLEASAARACDATARSARDEPARNAPMPRRDPTA